MGQYVIRYDHLRSAAFRPIINVKEMLQMTTQDTLDLLGLLVAERNFDVVIVDTSTVLKKNVPKLCYINAEFYCG